MLLRRNKKIEEEKKQPDYTNWEKDFGFLNLILTRKKNITKQYVVGIYSEQKKDTDYLTDDEIEKIVNQIVPEVLEQIGQEYLSFIIDKYFGTKENLIKFIAEDVYIDLTTDAINRNLGKIKNNFQTKMIKSIGKLSAAVNKK